MKKHIFSLFLILSIVLVFSQDNKPKSLLEDMTIQFQCTEAVDSLYNGNFLVAEKQFGWLIEEHPEHPLGYFLMALSNWWKILPNDEVKKYDEKFYYYVDLTIEKGKALYKKDKKNPEASFFLASAYGLRGRRMADNDQTLKAVFPADKASDFITKNLELGDNFGPEFLLGHGLYNFFREWLAYDNPSLRPVLAPFKKGDMVKGLAQLERCANESFYSRIEAKVFLMDIYSRYGVYNGKLKVKKAGDPKKYQGKAYEIALNLYRTYPNNKYFERRLAEISFYLPSRTTLTNPIPYSPKQLKGMKENGLALAQKILNVEKKYPGTYGKEAVRNLSYFLGNNIYYQAKIDTVSKKKVITDFNAELYKKVVDLAVPLDLESAGFTMQSYLRMGDFHNAKGEKLEASKYYDLYVENFSDSDKSYQKKHRENKKVAKDYVKEHGEKKFLGIF